MEHTKKQHETPTQVSFESLTDILEIARQEEAATLHGDHRGHAPEYNPFGCRAVKHE